jgi:striatin 1/3/4
MPSGNSIQYLTSPQAMNPFPSRQLMNNPLLPVTLPNVPSFDQIAYNARPRKNMSEVGKEFPILNSVSMMSGAPTTPASSGSQMSILEHGNILGPGLMQAQQNQPSSTIGHQYQQQQGTRSLPQHLQSQDARSGLSGMSALGASSWDRRVREDDDEAREEDEEVDDDESRVLGEGDGTKAWKVKRTLRKSVALSD